MKTTLFLVIAALVVSAGVANASTIYCPSPTQIQCNKGQCNKVNSFTVSEGGYKSPQFQATDFCGAQYNIENKGTVSCSYVDSHLIHRDPSTGKSVADSCKSNPHNTQAIFNKTVNLSIKHAATSNNNWIVISEGQWGVSGWCYNPASVNVNTSQNTLNTNLCPIIS
ncbi:hypothetical protein OAO18_05940 [Francisellaceae bacterium]|nr:hypothetical protein [Francisellaceae bacterium]